MSAATPTVRYTSYGTITPTRRPPSLRSPPEDSAFGETSSFSSSDIPIGTLHRGLSSRQVQMIAIAGTIGTGLFLGTGRSLAQGGPASMLICYSIVGFIVYVTLLLLGEMATQYPIAGECFSGSLAMFAEERSCDFITLPSFLSVHTNVQSLRVKIIFSLAYYCRIWQSGS